MLRLKFWLCSVCLLMLTWGGAGADVSLISGIQGQGSYEFAEEFSRLWHAVGTAFRERLNTQSEPHAIRRLEALHHQRGQLAIVDVDTAVEHLQQYGNLSAVSALWSNSLQIVSFNPSLKVFAPISSLRIIAHPSAADFMAMIKPLFRENGHLLEIHWQNEPDLELAASGEVDALLSFAPYPLQGVHEVLEVVPDSQVITISKAISETLRRQRPWMQIQSLPANTYVRQSKPIAVLTSFQVMVARDDTPDQTVTAVIQFMQKQSRAFAASPLFETLEVQNSRLLKNRLRFHPAAQKTLRL